MPETPCRGGDFFVLAQSAETVFTPEDLSAEHRMIQRTVQDFIDGEVVPAMEAMEDHNYAEVVRLLKQAGEIGLLSLNVPEEFGGLGLDQAAKCIVAESVGKTGAYGVAHINHVGIATLPITFFGTRAQKQRYLQKLGSGEYLGAYCLTEPSSGSDALGAKTTAKLNTEGTHYVLNGTKQFITNAGFSDTFIVYAKVDGTRFTAFVVEKDNPGLRLGPEERKMGIQGSSTRQVYFEDCLVPVSNVIGEVGRGHVIAFNVLNLGRFNLGAASLGAAKYALDLGVAYAAERRQFGQPLIDFSNTAEKLAVAASRVYAAESLQYRTAELLESALQGLYDEVDAKTVDKKMKEYALECSVCKVFGSETLGIVVDESLQIHGGYGYMKDYDIERVYRDARINRIFEGTNEINRLLLAGTLLRKMASGDLQLAKAIKSAQSELGNMDALGTPFASFQGESELHPLSRVASAVKSVRRLLLSTFGHAYAEYGPALELEQELMMRLADAAIELYAMESAVLRTEKAMIRNGAQKESLKIALTKVFVGESLQRVEIFLRQVLQSVFSRQKEAPWTQILARELESYADVHWMENKRFIAVQLREKSGYTC
ncbi:acyl-CoA dehydrogenase family protein [Alicyclobacillus tolerans]|uniref:acyl-CoA dehydrogenase family protein n=1 Tax=Alicyclobacillus tolerans TaxID=90970 RepID=UPI001F384E15|nr:acyl-CoA dehydrogenase family protein [Alicyclobacillus tolerans]MCF8564338.1 acyl-CoA dehydrogenase family protein [Alicyclobacillus tolerans]